MVAAAAAAVAAVRSTQHPPPRAPIDYNLLVRELTVRAQEAAVREQERFEAQLNHLPLDDEKDVNQPLKKGARAGLLPGQALRQPRRPWLCH